MRISLVNIVVSLLLVLTGLHANSQEVVSPERLPQTERSVFTLDGRYFVASAEGIGEVKRSPDRSANCSQDATQLLTLCRLVAPVLQGRACVFTGMTTDGIYLYAVCTIGEVFTVEQAALFRILPGTNTASEVQVRRFNNPGFYNGMTVIAPDTLLLTDTGSNPLLGGTGPAVVKLTVTNPATLEFDLRTWLASSPLLLAPNGITRDGDFVYLVGGQNLFRIRLLPGGNAGVPVLIFQTLINQLMDDLVAVGDRIAVAEIAVINGLGVNSITFVNKSGLGLPLRLPTFGIQISSLALDRGTLFDPGDLLGTSFFQGGLYRFSLR